MAESSALRFTTRFRSLSGISPTADPSQLKISFRSAFPSARFSGRRSESRGLLRSLAGDQEGGDGFGDDAYGPYPWDPSFSSTGGFSINWVPEDRITLFTDEGLVQIGGSLVPRRVPSSNVRQGGTKTSPRIHRFQESDYMNPVGWNAPTRSANK